jgi:DNA-directed RNA polymerase subunit F
MPRKVLEKNETTIAEAGKMLSKIKEDEMGEFQRRVLEYTQKFSRISADKAKKLVKELNSNFEIERKEAVQIVNCMPKSVGELRSTLSAKGKIFSTEQLEAMLKIIDKFREK